MTEAIASLTDLTPIGAVLVIASLLAVGITQAAKQQSWTKQRTQLVAAGVAGILGLLAAIVLGLIAGIPDSIVQVVSSILLSIAAVLVLARALYGALGYVLPDGATDTVDVLIERQNRADAQVATALVTAHDARAVAAVAQHTADDARTLAESSPLEHGRRADRDGTPDARDTPADG